MPNHLDLFPLAVLPGTRLFETAASFGLEHQPGNPYLVTGSPTFGPEALAQAARLARGCDVFYNEGKAVPWFALVQGALETEPSTLFARFADFLDSRPGGDLIELQRAFILDLFEERGCPGQGAVAADLITYFGLSARLAERASQAHLAPDACPVNLRHDPFLLLEQLAAGITELEDLSYVLPEVAWNGLLHLQDGETVLVALAVPE
jgi:hypothetical protein